MLGRLFRASSSYLPEWGKYSSRCLGPRALNDVKDAFSHFLSVPFHFRRNDEAFRTAPALTCLRMVTFNIRNTCD